MERFDPTEGSDSTVGTFTEGINYLDTPLNTSVWGEMRVGIAGVLSELPRGGAWLDIGAGDGRYTSFLLSRFEQVTAIDADRSALAKLDAVNNNICRERLNIFEYNVVNSLPFSEETFDGVLSTGLLHYFEEILLKEILLDVHRVLRPRGFLVFDLSTEVQRVQIEGNILMPRRGAVYTRDSAYALLESLGDIFKFSIKEQRVQSVPMLILGMPAKWSSLDLQVLGVARK
ncbi:class I SAM-dependent methyltransferase (plasmid) [Cupriavidus metallidurans]|uniref:class I SAM-dependent methyltransferase n=1 Tax=Cupriavidus metallidurans TaxID=119219 RepID=UPI003D74346A